MPLFHLYVLLFPCPPLFYCASYNFKPAVRPPKFSNFKRNSSQALIVLQAIFTMAPVLRNVPSRQNRGGSAEQQANNNALAHLNRGWPRRAIGSRTRGIARPTIECYRREMVKAFLHCPRILNWIDTHQTFRYRCRYAGDRRHKPARRCPACAFKKLAETYWSNGSTAAAINQRIRELDTAAFWQNLPTRWLDSRNQMEDPSRYADHLINAFRDSNRIDANLPAWDNQALAMFSTDLVHTDTCTGCNHTTTRPDAPMNTFQVPILATGHDDLLQAISRKMISSIDKRCSNCSGATDIGHDTVTCIRAAPQVLFVQLLIFQNFVLEKEDPEDKTDAVISKLDTTVTFPRMLDLTRHQTNTSRSLRYNLQAVTSHYGAGINSGHYMGQMKPPTGIFKTNDTQVYQSNAQDFTEWPQRWNPPTAGNNNNSNATKKGKKQKEKEGTPFTPYVLTYVMDFGN